ncbi:MAG: hypothetical protein AAF747_07140, partial [Planctomycetota bacterium]
MPIGLATLSSSPRPVVVVGTTQTVSDLAAQCVAVDCGIRGVGCVIVGDAEANPRTSRQPTRKIFGLRVLGGLDELRTARVKYDAADAVICLPMDMDAERDAAVDAATEAGLGVRVVPPLAELIAGHQEVIKAESASDADAGKSLQAPAAIATTQPRLDLARLIDREPREIDPTTVEPIIAGRRVLI